jgi:acyl carrier protein phosphodiesterase
MNYLAHLYLSGEDEEILIGNFIADHVKGEGILKFNSGIQNGIRLHRAIDTFTDSHPVYMISKNRLKINYRKYAGVVADMFYDHFLSAYWPDYSDENLDNFINRIHIIFIKNFPILPERSQRFIAYMKKFNWLKGYGTFDGLNRALSGMAMRTPFKSGMEYAAKDLKEHYELFRREFQLFFPEIIDFSLEFKRTF